MAKSVSPQRVGADLDESMFAAIGRVSVQWAFLEWTVQIVFSRMIGFGPSVPNAGQLIAARIRRIDTMNEIMKIAIPSEWNADRKDALAKTMAAIKILEEERNKVVHWTWWKTFTDRALAESKTSAGNPPPIQRSTAEIMELSENINRANALLMFVAMTQTWDQERPEYLFKQIGTLTEKYV